MPHIERILCPVDFSDTSRHALRYAIDLARELHASVLIAHAYQLPAYSLPDGAVLARPEFAAHITTEIQKHVDGLVQEHGAKGVEVRARIVEGLPYAEINRLAKEEHIDLVVMGTHGRTGVQHLLLGSVTERVVRTSAVPVLTVRRPG